MSSEPQVIVSCDTWTLNLDADSGDNFWWNDTYSISVWEKCLKIDRNSPNISETDVWRAYIEFQLRNVFKVCGICHEPEGSADLKICCYCGHCVHEHCSVKALPENIEYKPANQGFEDHMRICFSCEGVPFESKTNVGIETRTPDTARKAAIRLITLSKELPQKAISMLQKIVDDTSKDGATNAQNMKKVQDIAQQFFQTSKSLTLLKKEKIPQKGGGIGVIAANDIPAFTIIGLYPGYDDFLSGEHSKIGRPVAKYALMDLNCADYFNVVFPEFDSTFAPFINEPMPSEKSNCAWIQEPHQAHGRLSIISVCEIKKGEELLIGYGPVYPRTYEYRYDAYAFHRAGDYTNPICFALWHWPTTEEKDSRFVCYVAYSSQSHEYVEWEEEEKR